MSAAVVEIHHESRTETTQQAADGGHDRLLEHDDTLRTRRTKHAGEERNQIGGRLEADGVRLDARVSQQRQQLQGPEAVACGLCTQPAQEQDMSAARHRGREHPGVTDDCQRSRTTGRVLMEKILGETQESPPRVG